MEILSPTRRKKCDFCAEGIDAKWSYSCGEFTMEEVAIRFQNEWLACDACSEMIDQENLKGLMERALETWCKAYPERVRDEAMKTKLKNLIYQTHLEFFKKRTQWRKEVIK